MLPLYEQSLVGIIVGGSIIPIKACEYKGEYPKVIGHKV